MITDIKKAERKRDLRSTFTFLPTTDKFTTTNFRIARFSDRCVLQLVNGLRFVERTNVTPKRGQTKTLINRAFNATNPPYYSSPITFPQTKFGFRDTTQFREPTLSINVL